MEMDRAVIIGGAHSGSGKTTVSIGLMAVLRRRGLIVQPFKVGPDYIDPGLHEKACERRSYSLDPWMMGEKGLKETFFHNMTGANMGIIEGVMGLFDGRNDDTATSSTAHVAMMLNLPVILVIDARSVAQSVGAIVYGFENYMPELKLVGVVFNRVAGDSHYEMLRRAVKERCRVSVLGYLPRDPAISIPERHLGLAAPEDKECGKRFLHDLADITERHVDIDRVLEIAAGAAIQKPSGVSSIPSPSPTGRGVRIAVALDEAFWFYYHDNLDVLEAAGAEIVFFSPLHDRLLPGDIAAIYFGGGYPELYARGLSENNSMRKAIKEWAGSGGPIYGECGGLMILTEGIYDFNGAFFEMTGVYETRVRMTRERLRLGYREVEFLERTILGDRGDRVRGHEFHYSELLHQPENARGVYSPGSSRLEGWRVKNTFSSYIHIHFKSNDRIGSNFVAFCRQESPRK